MGADFGAAVGGAAGFGQPSTEHLAGQGHAVGQLRFGTNHGAAAALRVGDGEGAPVHSDGTLELNVHQGGFSGLVRLLRFLEPLGVIPGFGGILSAKAFVMLTSSVPVRFEKRTRILLPSKQRWIG